MKAPISTSTTLFGLITAGLMAGLSIGAESDAAEHGVRPDTDAASVWSHLQDEQYREYWKLWPGKKELYEGREPHGMLLTTYLNDAAASTLKQGAGKMADGAIIVKENYTPDKDLASITVMYKVDGYNPRHNDWFFVKYQPDGTPAKMPDGTPVAGKVASCQGCHGQQAENDYIFTGSLSGD